MGCDKLTPPGQGAYIVDESGFRINPAIKENQVLSLAALANILSALGGSAGVVDTPEFFEDTSFVVGDSPATLDFNTALGRNATQGWIKNDGNGNFTVSFSNDGAAFGDEITVKAGEKLVWEQVSVDSLRVTHVADSSYRALAL